MIFKACTTYTKYDEDDNEIDVNVVFKSNRVSYISPDFDEIVMDIFDYEDVLKDYGFTQQEIYKFEEQEDYDEDYNGSNIIVKVSDVFLGTGQLDKNGNLIYEGDTLKSIYSDVMRYKVIWKDSAFKLEVHSVDFGDKVLDELYLKDCGDQYEVISKEITFNSQKYETNSLQYYTNHITDIFNSYIKLMCDTNNPKDIVYTKVTDVDTFGSKLIDMAIYITDKYFALIKDNKDNLAKKFLNYMSKLISGTLYSFRKYPNCTLGAAIHFEAHSLANHKDKKEAFFTAPTCDCCSDDNKIIPFLTELEKIILK
jgi:hypothetical protein